ncbi:MAG TPA: hypothetical protein VE396_07700 [Xanthobacteraceae bacterium]|nr:hypothetical protein [Xanthobacteraceae bacterium]
MTRFHHASRRGICGKANRRPCVAASKCIREGQAQLRKAFSSERSGSGELHHPLGPNARESSLKTDEWQAIGAEIKRHPAPNDSDSKTLTGLLVGEWKSPRHDYLYWADGTWTMLPVEEVTTPMGAGALKTINILTPPLLSQYTIILITKNDFVFADQTYVFYETRTK